MTASKTPLAWTYDRCLDRAGELLTDVDNAITYPGTFHDAGTTLAALQLSLAQTLVAYAQVLGKK